MALALIAIGIGLLAAIIGFGDKIKDVKKEIREHEKAFLKKLGTDWETLRPLLRSDEDPDAKLTSVGLLIAGSKLNIPVLEMFEKAEKRSKKLRICHLRNYYYLIFLTVMVFSGAMFDFIVSDKHKFKLFCLSLSKEVVVVTIIVFISLCIIFRMILTRIREERFRNLLDQIGDRI